MEKLRKNGAEAWPISRPGHGYRPVLEKVIIESHHPEGHGVVHLTPDQALYVHSRLSHITSAFLRGHSEGVQHLGIPALPEDHLKQMSRCGAKVWPISHVVDSLPPMLEEVVIENAGPEKKGLIHLTPEQAEYIHGRLTHITLAFLHENAWGGEDAIAQ